MKRFRLPVGWCSLMYGCGVVTVVLHAVRGEMFMWGSLLVLLTAAFVQSLRWMWQVERLESSAGEELIAAALRVMTWALAVIIVVGLAR